MIRFLLIVFLLSFGVQIDAEEAQTGYRLIDEPAHLTSPLKDSNRVALSLPFQSEGHKFDQGMIYISHRAVKERWEVRLEGKRLGFLDQIEQPTWTVLKFSQRSTPRPEDKLEIIAPSAVDSVEISEISVHDGSFDQRMQQSRIDVRIVNERGEPIPARMTVLDGDGYLAPLSVVTGREQSAVRTGVVYTSTGSFSAGLASGVYDVFLNRGPEYERAVFRVELKDGERRSIHAQLKRSVDTVNWISCDPHTHTFTNSRHGDATIEERVITFAGEALELPVATDHNILTDYLPAASKLKVGQYFTPVIGDEVTTKEAHFNVFPLTSDARLPDFRILNWEKLLEHFLQVDSERIVILNHPHNVHNGFRPFDRQHFNPVSGRVVDRINLNVTAMEVLSSSAQQSDMMLVFRDWFALLNQGYRVVGLGSSDVHDVNRYIVGQGRTYILGGDSNPGSIDVAEACRSLAEGRALISMGLFVNMTVNDHGRVGDTVTSDQSIKVDVSVQSASWLPFDQVKLFANGALIRSQALNLDEPSEGNATEGNQSRITWHLNELQNDTHLIAMATGPGNIGPSWPIPNPYQPSEDTFVPRIAGATNPIWVDRDGDGEFSSAREIAERLWIQNDKSVAKVVRRLIGFDVSVGIQVADLALQFGTPFWDELSIEESRQLNADLQTGIARLQSWHEETRAK